jgi:Flp pilus assembly protein TadB
LGGERDIGKMDPFDWKNNPVWILLTMPWLIVVFFVIGIKLGHSLLSGVLSIAVILLVLFLYISRKSRKQRGIGKYN